MFSASETTRYGLNIYILIENSKNKNYLLKSLGQNRGGSHLQNKSRYRQSIHLIKKYEKSE